MTVHFPDRFARVSAEEWNTVRLSIATVVHHLSEGEIREAFIVLLGSLTVEGVGVGDDYAEAMSLLLEATGMPEDMATASAAALTALPYAMNSGPGAPIDSPDKVSMRVFGAMLAEGQRQMND